MNIFGIHIQIYRKTLFFHVFLAIFLLKLCLKLIASEASEENFEKN